MTAECPHFSPNRRVSLLGCITSEGDFGGDDFGGDRLRRGQEDVKKLISLSFRDFIFDPKCLPTPQRSLIRHPRANFLTPSSLQILKSIFSHLPDGTYPKEDNDSYKGQLIALRAIDRGIPITSPYRAKPTPQPLNLFRPIDATIIIEVWRR